MFSSVAALIQISLKPWGGGGRGEHSKAIQGSGGHNFLEGINHCICYINWKLHGWGRIMVPPFHILHKTPHASHITSYITQNTIIEILSL